MGNLVNVKGDIITHIKYGSFDVVVHGCNCFCKMKSGLAAQISKNYPIVYEADLKTIPGDYNKLGNYTYAEVDSVNDKNVIVVNCYIQYNYGRTNKRYVDYDALRLCLRKINFKYSHKKIGLPKIGSGLAGGDWNIIKNIITEELKDMSVFIVSL
jgi:O-acetyl-ADP-ribose deacetylase (regulator of RNase III)